MQIRLKYKTAAGADFEKEVQQFEVGNYGLKFYEPSEGMHRMLTYDTLQSYSLVGVVEAEDKRISARYREVYNDKNEELKRGPNRMAT